jgi:hypothetical protein
MLPVRVTFKKLTAEHANPVGANLALFTNCC